MKIKHLFDKVTFTLTYIVFDENSKDAVIIDPVLDFDPASGDVATTSLMTLLDEVRGLGVNVKMILETHAHADHLSSSQTLKDYFSDAILAMGENIVSLPKRKFSEKKLIRKHPWQESLRLT